MTYLDEQLGLALATDGPYETIAGLVTHQIGRLAEEGDQIELPDAVLTIVAAGDR
ncbi:transporter associated domain-containing protein [Halovenus halobia]|uniref:transporter associated domain-containing protein n=1 Tax=Halovenus halobia TaxID=3396622 RepID=UPI003F56E7FF